MEKDTLIQRLETIEKRADYLQHMMTLPSVIEDFQKYKMFAKEFSNLEKISKIYKEYKDILQTVEDAHLLLKDNDPEMIELAKAEINENEPKLEEYLKKIQIELIPKDPNDGKNVIVEIRGAAGGDEANIFAGDLFRMYTRFAESQKWTITMNDTLESEAGGFSLVSFTIKGKDVYSSFKYESGAHRVQRVPRTEASGRIHTSTATVLVMPEAEELDVEIKDEDIRVDTYRSSGAGGQHINKTESAIRLTHFPTGIVVSCQDGRSQIENKEIAMQNLRTRIWAYMKEQAENERGAERRSKIGTGDRSEKIRTYNYPQNRVTDHRIGYTVNQLEKIINGDLTDLINALTNEDQRLKLIEE
ncbi:MAG: peptide chain release factor 1 [Bacillales bacterium]|jgi:peptide chain release factor 1|nr:peptide chain release factor 1 [Bacillales bacterium]